MNRMIAALVLCPLWASAQEEVKGRIAGKVVDSVTLAPLRKATVMLFGNSGNRPQSLRTNSDADGNFSFETLSEGVYELRGEKTAYLNSTYGANPSGAGGSPISLSKGEKRQALQLKLIPQSAIGGRVLDEDGDPLDKVEVNLIQRTYQNGKIVFSSRASGNSNDRGEFRVAGIPPGKYYLCLERMGGSDSIPAQGESTGTAYLPVYFPGVDDINQAQAIQLAAGQEVYALSLILRRTKVFSVRGRFLDRAFDSQKENLFASVHPKVAGFFGMGFGNMNRSDINPKDNSFEFKGLAPGTYSIAIRGISPKGNRLAGKLDITIGNSNLDRVEVPPVSMVPLTVRVRVEGDSAAIDPKNLAIGLVPLGVGSNHPLPFQYKEGGRFEAAGLAPEKHLLVPEIRNQNLYVKSIFAGGKAVTDSIVDLSGGAGLVVELVLSTKVGQIEGMVEKESAGQSFGDVWLVPVGGGRHLRAKLVPTGKFSAPNLGPGEYLVYALEEYDPWLFDPDVLPKLASKAVKVKLSEGETKSITVKQITWEEIEKADK